MVRGNHDRACCGLEDLEWFNPIARAATVWTIAHLSPSNFEYLRELPAGPVRVNGFQLIHGSPLDEDEYVISASDARNVFDYLEANITFFGHTHLQCGYAHVDGYFQIMRPLDPFLAEVWHRLDRDGIYLINAGSVGQPRDGDSRAAYALFDTETLEVVQRRVPYDYGATGRKIEAARVLPGRTGVAPLGIRSLVFPGLCPAAETSGPGRFSGRNRNVSLYVL